MSSPATGVYSRRALLLGAAGGLAAAPAADRRPEYPLYSPYFGTRHSFSDEDLRRLAHNFDFVYGQTLTPGEMRRARLFRAAVRFIRYTGSWTVGAKEAEPRLRRDILYFHCATLGASIPPAGRELALEEAPDYRPLRLLASTTGGLLSKSANEYVTWLRIGEELMRIEAFDARTLRARVTRGFDGSPAQAHARGARVLSPEYGIFPAGSEHTESRDGLSYHYDPARPARWSRFLETLSQFVEQGGDGIWIDILMDRSLREKDAFGRELPTVDAKTGRTLSWDFAGDRYYTRDEFRRRNEAGVRSIQERFRRRFGRHPVIYANNMMASRYEEGHGGHRLYLLPTPDKPRPLDGMCMEDWAGGYEQPEWDAWSTSRAVSAPKKSCFPCDAGYKNWRANVECLMRSARQGLAAMPLILNAGMKTAIFEALPRGERHEWERWAYASYLLAVEKKNGVCPTKLGVPMFYRDGESRRVDIDLMYFWPIGEPMERLNLGSGDVFTRRFSNGLVLVNPGGREQTVHLEGTLTDPESDERVTVASLAPQSGKILLRRRLSLP